MAELIDPVAILRPLLDACPGSKVVTCCRRCGENIAGPAALDERDFFIHLDGCPVPEAPPPPPPQGILML